jgi:hypothetical protein
MSATRDPDHILHAWLEEGPTVLPAPTVRAIEVATRVSARRRPAIRLPWRSDPMPFLNKFLGAAAVIAIVAVATFASLNLLGVGTGTDPTPHRSPTVAATAAPTPTALPIDWSTWVRFTSSQYRFPLASRPATWSVNLADRAWDIDTDAMDKLSPAMDTFTAPSGDLRVSVWTVPFDPGKVVDETWNRLETWIEQYCEKAGNSSCDGIREQAVRMCVHMRTSCYPAVLVLAPDREVQAFFTGGTRVAPTASPSPFDIYNGRLVVLTVWARESDLSVARYGGARRLIEAFLTTMCVVPEGASNGCG